MCRFVLLLSLFSVLYRIDFLGDEPSEIDVKVRSSTECGLVPILSVIERYPSHRKCFSCHHQTLSIQSAREAGIEGDFGGDSMIRSGVEFLMKSQQEDGSRFVQTRSKPVQTWYDNGDPHGKSQFISTPVSCWAVAVLAKYLANELSR